MDVSIVIPTYNRPNSLRRLLNSIKAQTFQEFEIIVVNDCSLDRSAYDQVIKEYRAGATIQYLVNARRSGAPKSRNRGILAAQGKYLALVDDDDAWLPTKLEKQVAIFQQSDERVGLVYTWAEVRDAQDQFVSFWRPESEGDVRAPILQSCFIPSPSVMVTKKAINDAGLFDPDLPSCQDWDMWTRIFLKGYTGRVVRSIEAVYHQNTPGSVGTSPHALKGYARYYKKHLSSAWNISIPVALYMLYRYTKVLTRLTIGSRR
jgi:glycosyltransferase involved in cell wall biosynthesis